MKIYIAIEPETNVMFASPCFKTVYNAAVLEMRFNKNLRVIQVFTIDSNAKWINTNFERHVIDLIRCIDNSVALARHDKQGELLDVHNMTLREIQY